MRLDALSPHRSLLAPTRRRNLAVDPRQKATRQDGPGSTQTNLDDLEVVRDFNTCHGQLLPQPSRTGLWMPLDLWPAPTDAPAHALPERPLLSPPSEGPVEAAGAVDAQTDARPQAPWTPASGRRRPQLPQASPHDIDTKNEKEETGFIESVADALRAKPVDGLRSSPVGRRPQVSVGGTALPTRSRNRLERNGGSTDTLPATRGGRFSNVPYWPGLDVR